AAPAVRTLRRERNVARGTRARGATGGRSFGGDHRRSLGLYYVPHMSGDGAPARTKRAVDAEQRRDRIVDVAMQHFAEHGFRAARVEDIAHDVGIAKGTVFLDFGSKEALFLAAYQRAVRLLPAWLDAPAEIVEQGFWATLDWWLVRTEGFVTSDPVPHRIATDSPDAPG